MSSSVWTALQFVLVAYVILLVVALFVSFLIIVVRRAVAPKESAPNELQKERR